jgi:hypothetical protein
MYLLVMLCSASSLCHYCILGGHLHSFRSSCSASVTLPLDSGLGWASHETTYLPYIYLIFTFSLRYLYFSNTRCIAWHSMGWINGCMDGWMDGWDGLV